MEELIKNMMFDINYNSLYFITAHQGKVKGGEITLLFNLYEKRMDKDWYYFKATEKTLDELKEVLTKLGVK